MSKSLQTMELGVFCCTLGWVSLLENNSDLTRELVEQNFDGNLSRCTDHRPVLRKIVLWQAHHHPYAVGHGRPHSRPLHFSDPLTGEEYRPVSVHLLGTIRQRTESAKKEVCFMSGTTVTVVVKYLVENLVEFCR